MWWKSIIYEMVEIWHDIEWLQTAQIPVDCNYDAVCLLGSMIYSERIRDAKHFVSAVSATIPQFETGGDGETDYYYSRGGHMTRPHDRDRHLTQFEEYVKHASISPTQELVDRLAEREHERRRATLRCATCEPQEPEDLAAWRRLAATEFADLSESERDACLLSAVRTIGVFREFFLRSQHHPPGDVVRCAHYRVTAFVIGRGQGSSDARLEWGDVKHLPYCALRVRGEPCISPDTECPARRHIPGEPDMGKFRAAVVREVGKFRDGGESS